ncbi:MFS transporter [Streptomyces sp. NPDC046977]|uniref:MFS transporter n=1 Tax=Streptomyces sp. NPDC046977 TaxID=3154703 RepID=UPI0033E375B7
MPAALYGAILVMAAQQTLVVPLLPAIGRTFGTGLSATTWSVTAFLLSASVAAPVLAKIGDAMGRRRAALAALAVQLLGSALTSVAPGFGLFLTGRALGGVGTALFPLCVGLVREHLDYRRAPAGISMLSAMMGAGAGAGMLMPGLIDLIRPGPRAAFATGTLALAVAWFLLRRSVPADKPSRISRRGLDMPGALLLVLTVLPALLGISQASHWGWGHPATITLLSAALMSGVVWTRWELRTPAPLVDLRIVAHGIPRNANVIAVLLGFGMFAYFTVISTYAQAAPSGGYGVASSPLQVGLLLLPSGVAMVALAPLSARLSASVGTDITCALGSGLVAAAFWWLAARPGDAPTLWTSSVLFGAGMGIGYAALSALAVHRVPADQTSVVTGVNGLMRTLGGSVSGAVTSLVLVGGGHTAAGAPSGHSYRLVFLLLGAACSSATLLAVYTQVRGFRPGVRSTISVEDFGQSGSTAR